MDLERFGLEKLRLRQGVKWSLAGPEVLPAWVADMDFPIAAPIAKMLADAVVLEDLGYPSGVEEDAVRSSFAARMRRRYGWEVDPGLVIVTSEVVQSIYLALLAYASDGEGVIVQTPVYPPFLAAVADTGRKLVDVPLAVGDDGYFVDKAQLVDKVRSSGARVMLVCNPQNPTGRVLSLEELNALGDVALEEDLIVISDEIHADLVYPGGRHIPFALANPAAADRCITLYSASKAFNIAGLRCAVAAFGTAELKAAFERFPHHARGGLSALGVRAALAAWDEGDPWLDEVLGYLDSNRSTVGKWLGQFPHVKNFVPQSTYLWWMDVSSLGLGDDPTAALAERAGVMLSPGADYGRPGVGHVRLNFATPRPILGEILDRLSPIFAAGAR